MRESASTIKYGSEGYTRAQELGRALLEQIKVLKRDGDSEGYSDDEDERGVNNALRVSTQLDQILQNLQ